MGTGAFFLKRPELQSDHFLPSRAEFWTFTSKPPTSSAWCVGIRNRPTLPFHHLDPGHSFVWWGFLVPRPSPKLELVLSDAACSTNSQLPFVFGGSLHP
jgi:hypothetical protein